MTALKAASFFGKSLYQLPSLVYLPPDLMDHQNLLRFRETAPQHKTYTTTHIGFDVEVSTPMVEHFLDVLLDSQGRIPYSTNPYKRSESRNLWPAKFSEH